MHLQPMNLSSHNVEWMGPVYDLLGVTVGVNLLGMNPKEKQDTYNKDILYSTNNEVGFDFLRINNGYRKRRQSSKASKLLYYR